MRKIIRVVKLLLKNLYILRRGVVFVHWYDEGNNFGDILNYQLVSMISNKKVINVNSKYFFFKHYMVIGSILEHSTNKSIVWGSGFIAGQEAGKKTKVRDVYAVRGPSTRKQLVEKGIDCPKIFGDPALLLPLFYQPKLRKKYRVGLVPHYSDFDSVEVSSFLKENPMVRVIDLINPEPLKVVDQIIECEFILSSSLHGLIVADAYNIPNQWATIGPHVIGKGFKFYDYFYSVGKSSELPIELHAMKDLNGFIEACDYKKIQFDEDQLLDSCPFKFSDNFDEK